MNELKNKLEMFCHLSGINMEDVRKLFVEDVKQVEREKKWLTIKQTAKLYRVCYMTIYRQIKENKIKYKRIRRKILVQVDF